MLIRPPCAAFFRLDRGAELEREIRKEWWIIVGIVAASVGGGVFFVKRPSTDLYEVQTPAVLR